MISRASPATRETAVATEKIAVLAARRRRGRAAARGSESTPEAEDSSGTSAL